MIQGLLEDEVKRERKQLTGTADLVLVVGAVLLAVAPPLFGYAVVHPRTLPHHPQPPAGRVPTDLQLTRLVHLLQVLGQLHRDALFRVLVQLVQTRETRRLHFACHDLKHSHFHFLSWYVLLANLGRSKQQSWQDVLVRTKTFEPKI